ncbi:MAG: hypothetical protein B6244_10795 [Candidatus Cloacimonetes bacterium 4572_55]|nr:MAG: hypothetical protein B6244_10795 [Candidatus Cloacimonetes bacterium 4572_55]
MRLPPYGRWYPIGGDSPVLQVYATDDFKLKVIVTSGGETAVDIHYVDVIFTGANLSSPNILAKFILEQNSPNPFNPITTIRYQLPQATHVKLEIFNTAGQLIRSLADHEESAGFKSVQWDGQNDHGAQVVSGLYFYRLETGDYEQTRRMLLLK